MGDNANLWMSRLRWEVLLQLLEKRFLKQFGGTVTTFLGKLHYSTISMVFELVKYYEAGRFSHLLPSGK